MIGSILGWLAIG